HHVLERLAVQADDPHGLDDRRWVLLPAAGGQDGQGGADKERHSAASHDGSRSAGGLDELIVTWIPSSGTDSRLTVESEIVSLMNRTGPSHRTKLAPWACPLPKLFDRASRPMADAFELIGQLVSPRLSCPEL